MGSGDSAALIVAWIALGVSVLAAAFTLWQAITAHLARTRQPPATWAVTTNGLSWWIHNLGGSAGNDVVVTITVNRGAEDHGRDVVWRSDDVGPITPGGHADVYFETLAPNPRMKYALDPNDGRMKPVSEPGTLGARYVVDATARVTWLDYRGKPRSAKVRLR